MFCAGPVMDGVGACVGVARLSAAHNKDWRSLLHAWPSTSASFVQVVGRLAHAPAHARCGVGVHGPVGTSLQVKVSTAAGSSMRWRILSMAADWAACVSTLRLCHPAVLCTSAPGAVGAGRIVAHHTYL